MSSRTFLGCVLLLVASSSPLTEWHRASDDPIISPRGNGSEAAGTFNPAVVIHDGKFVMLYRAQDSNGTSRLGTLRARTAFTSRDAPTLCSRPKQATRKMAASKILA